ncbi:MAG: hypothetical protein LAP85_15105 [Acidobacteriia bacterium]|nr:hypothetical protein [Terriglobia bacterium]
MRPKHRFNGEVLNPGGERIFITDHVFDKLARYAIRDHASGEIIRAIVWNKRQRLYQITNLAASLMDLWKSGPEFKPLPAARAIDPARCSEGGPPRDGGRANVILSTLGSDLSGLAAPSTDSIRRLRGKQTERRPRRPLQCN